MKYIKKNIDGRTRSGRHKKPAAEKIILLPIFPSQKLIDKLGGFKQAQKIVLSWMEDFLP